MDFNTLVFGVRGSLEGHKWNVEFWQRFLVTCQMD